MRLRCFETIRSTFLMHGAVSIDTPVFELRDVLMNKYGEDSKLIYHLSDDMSSESGEKLSLRYDLSVPFARYIATNNVKNIKRFHIGKVYRRDRPMMERGRFREFYQCDFDIAGAYPKMVPDAEVLCVMMQLFDNLATFSKFHKEALDSYLIKVSNRQILDAILSVCGVPDEKLRTICSAIDKLDKESWDTVRCEMVNEKGLDEQTADRIRKYVEMKGDPEIVLAQLREDSELMNVCADAINEMERLFMFISNMRDGMPNRISFDLSLARGLDYYTGVIFEVILTSPKYNVGSIGAGGRYDNLVGMFKKNSIPCVGCSLGIERIMNIMMKASEEEAQERFLEGGKIKPNDTLVMVVTQGKGTMNWRMKLAAELWRGGIPTEFCYNENWNMGKQITAALQGQIPFIVVVGEDEIKEGVVKIKNLQRKEERVVKRENVVEELNSEIQSATSQGEA